MAGDAYDTAMDIRGYAQMITSGVSAGNILMSVAVNVGMEVAGGKMFDMLSSARRKLMRGLKNK